MTLSAARTAFITAAVFVVSSVRGLPAPQATPRTAQQPPPPVSYAVDVSLVEVDAVVTDAEGKVIRDLVSDEFHVFEDGRPQALDRMALIEIPIERANARSPLASRPLADVQSNLQRFDGRLYVLLLDDLHTSALRSERVKAAAREFIEHRLGPSDLAAVVHVSASRDSQDFTTDRTRLLASVDRFAGRMLRSETLNRIEEYNRLVLSTGRIPDQVKDLDEPSRAQDARTVFDVIAGISRRVTPVRGRRKALLWFGEGVSYDMFDIVGRQQASDVLESSSAAVAAASRANVTIYGIDARGLRGLGEEAMQLTSPAVDPTRSLGASALNQEVFRSQQNLRRVSDETGGFAVVNTGEFAHAFERVVEENSEYYVLGYYSTNSNRDGTFRRLEVRVDRPGATVRARSGYVVSAAKPELPRAETESEVPAALRDALVGAAPVSGVPLAVHTAAFKGSGGSRDRASLLVTVEYGPAAFENVGSDPRLIASAIAVEPGGKVAASDQSTITLNVKPETRQAMRAAGFRTHSRLELSPGRYQIRVAALLGETGLVGSVHQDVDVPDLSTPALAMSGLVMTAVDAGFTPTARFDERMREALPAPPTTSRAFRHDEAIAVFAEVYEHGGAPKHDVTMKARVDGEGGSVVFEREDVRTANDLKKSKGGYSLQISLRQFPPGDYVLHLQAESREAGSKPAAREVAFRVGEATSSKPTPGETPPRLENSPSIESLPIVAVAKGAISGVPQPRQAVARNAAEWSALWGSVSRRLAAPVVAFDNTMIVGVFLGARPTAGYEPEIVRVVREGESLVVEWREREPRDAGNPPNETTPFVIAGVPQHAGDVRFRKVGGAP